MMMLSFVGTLLLNVMSVQQGSSKPSSGCGVSPPITPGTSYLLDFDFVDQNFGTIGRTYRLLLPYDYNNSTEHLILFDFHGFSMDANEEEHESKTQLLTEKGVILVWPNGSNDTINGTQGWNGVGTDQKLGTCNTNRTQWGMCT